MSPLPMMVSLPALPSNSSRYRMSRHWCCRNRAARVVEVVEDRAAYRLHAAQRVGAGERGSPLTVPAARLTTIPW